MAESFILVPGRTSPQGVGISEGKFGDKYQREINVVLMAPEDMERLDLTDGDAVRMTSDDGQIRVAVKAAKAGDLPSGLLFIAYGDLSSRLMGSDTHGTGMPTSKGIDVTVERI
jgi:formylmethanofuran dehydrogenase subunit D